MATPPKNQNPFDTKIKSFGIPLVIFFLSLIFFLAWVSQFFDLSITEIIIQFKNSLYFPNMNQFIVGEINGRNVMTLFYWYLLCIVVVMSIYYVLFIYSPQKTQKISFSHFLILNLLAGLLLFAGIQQWHRFDFYKHEKNIYGGKSLEEKKLTHFGGFYQFPSISKQSLSGRHQGKIITDLDFRKSPYMFHHRLLSYHFYPEVSLRLDNGTPNDILFLYVKENPSQHIPENYEILLETQDQKYILAIKKGAKR